MLKDFPITPDTPKGTFKEPHMAIVEFFFRKVAHTREVFDAMDSPEMRSFVAHYLEAIELARLQQFSLFYDREEFWRDLLHRGRDSDGEPVTRPEYRIHEQALINWYQLLGSRRYFNLDEIEYAIMNGHLQSAGETFPMLHNTLINHNARERTSALQNAGALLGQLFTDDAIAPITRYVWMCELVRRVRGGDYQINDFMEYNPMSVPDFDPSTGFIR